MGKNRACIGKFASIAGSNTGSRMGIEESCPIEVYLEAALPDLFCNRGELLHREGLAASSVVGILQAKEFWTRKVDVIGADGGSQGLQGLRHLPLIETGISWTPERKAEAPASS